MSTRLNINLNDETAAALRQLAGSRGTTVTEQVRRAVGVYSTLEQAQSRGDLIQLVSGTEKTTIRLLS